MTTLKSLAIDYRNILDVDEDANTSKLSETFSACLESVIATFNAAIAHEYAYEALDVCIDDTVRMCANDDDNYTALRADVALYVADM